MKSTLAPNPILRYLRTHGPIPAVRVSSAQARGAAKRYSYWGAVRYEIRLRKSDDEIIVTACERASSDRRSHRLAVADMMDIAERENRLICPVSDESILTYIRSARRVLTS